MTDLQNIISNLPEKPGVYLYQDDKGLLIYVGKAINLKKRVKSYFSGDKDPKTQILVSKIANVSTIITNSETEALLLEDSLIKKHKPQYNIDLRDDKRYPYLRLSVDEAYPHLTIVRERKKDKAKYFGPYAGSVSETLKIINQIFKLRKCKESFRQRKKPCLFFQINQCLGPCANEVQKEYALEVERLKHFLEGDYEQITESLNSEMHRFSKGQQYEQAAEIRDKLKSLARIMQRQTIIAPDQTRRDIWHFAENEQWSAAVVLIMDHGRIIASREFSAKNTGADDTYKERLLITYYQSKEVLPQEVILPKEISFSGIAVKVIQPQSGFRSDLLLIARKNVLKLLQDKMMASFQNKSPVRGLFRLQEVLSLPKIPERIDCFDISHIQGSDTVASMTVLRQGVPDKASYRRYIIDQQHPDDFASMDEVLSRRYLKVASGESERPDLIVIDGGKGQLSVAVKVLKKFDLKIPLVSIAKREEELFIPGRLNPIVLKRSDPALRLLQVIRDEAHRFAVTFHRLRRKKRIIV